jgi:hypothetical protein
VDATLLSPGEGREGRDAIRSAVTALETNDYLVRTRCQRSGGKWITQTVIHENPQVEPKTEIQESVGIPPYVVTQPLQPKTEDQASENQASVFQALSNEELETSTEALLHDIETSPVDNRTDKVGLKGPSSENGGDRKLKGQLRDAVLSACTLDPLILRP